MNSYEYIILKRFEIEDRILKIGQYLIDNPECSIRKLSEEFMISKSQVHRDLHGMKYINDDLYVQIRNILRKRRRR